MGFVEGLVEWTQAAFLPLGGAGLFAVAFAESSFFPIPPDLLLIPLVLADPANWWLYALICTAGSVFGAALGWLIGRRAGRPILLRFASPEKVARVDAFFKKYGALAVGIAAFTPIPYKVFTIASGAFKYDLRRTLAVSVLGRGARFFSEAAVIWLWGKDIIAWLEKNFEFATLAAAAVIIILFFAWRRKSVQRGQARKA